MKHLIAQYGEDYPFYQSLTERFQSLLSVLLKSQALHIHSIVGRTKNKTSLAHKIFKANDKYHNLTDITDLCGLRIITYYEADVDKVAEFIRRHFRIDEENSIDKRTVLAADQFGTYRCI